MLPNLLIPGVTKSGTTSLFHYLGQHPQICPSDVKQVNYWSPLRYGRSPARPLSAYAGHFAHCAGEAYRLDASPNYLHGGPAVLEAVASHLPDPRIVVLLRDPVTRVWSGYTYKQSRDKLAEETSFEAFIDDCLQHRKAGTDLDEANNVYRILSTGFYVEDLRRWGDRFGEALRVVFFEDLVRDPASEVARLCAWLGIDQRAALTFDYEVRNKTAYPKSAGLSKAAEGLNRAFGRRLQRWPAVKGAVRTAYRSVNTRTVAPRPPEDQLQRLREHYRDANAQLAGYLRDRGCEALPAWLGGDRHP